MLFSIKKLMMISLLLGFFAQVNASELFVFQDSEVKSLNGKTAKIFLGVPVTVKKDLGESAQVTVHGFMFKNNVYSTKNKELLIAELSKGYKVDKKSGNEVSFTAVIEKGLLTKNASEIWEEHEEFYYEMCTQCHAAASVPHHTMVEWEALFAPMKGFAKLDEEESSYLIRYLKSNASNGLVKAEH